MQALREAIESRGQAVGSSIVKVDNFLNHRIDTRLMFAMGQALADHFRPAAPTLIMTVEASGIALAMAVAHALDDLPVVFAKKSPALNQGPNLVQERIYSFTHQTECVIRADRGYVPAGSRVLVVDDFLADGEAVRGMLSLVQQCQSQVIGVGIAIEKGFQPGGNALRAQGVDLKSLAVIREIRDGRILFCDC